jgi:ubiquinone/menaquinone biosynthesis C-methylase UbiE
VYTDRVLPRITNRLLDNPEHRRIRERVVSGLSGDVLEVGFGSGLNVPYLPAAVRRVQAVDPATLGRRLAADRVAASGVPVEYLDLEMDRLPLPAESVDHVLVTWTLCTIPDLDGALAEMRRVLRAGGALHFAEHGLSPDPSVAKWQVRLTPVQRLWAGGCHLDRPVARLLEAGGFGISELRTYYMPGPKVTGYTYEGRATKS